MKFLLSVLLFISELCSIIKTGMGLSCYQNDNAEECLRLLEELHKKGSYLNISETELDRDRQNVISCMKNSHEKYSIVTCDQTLKCNKLDVKFNGENKMSFKFCDRDESGLVCHYAKLLLTYHFAKDTLDYAACDYCETDKCNSDSKGKEIICYETRFDDECLMEMQNLLDASVRDKMRNVNKLKSEALNCWESEEMVHIAPCIESVCSTLTLKFKDGVQVVYKNCDFQDHRVCEFMKEMIQTRLTDVLSDAHCDFCSESLCNEALVGSSHPSGDESSDKKLTCWATQLESTCEIELMKWYKAQVGLQRDQDTLRNNALECLKGNQREVLVQCGKKNSHCSKLTLNFNDGDKTVFQLCDSKSICQNFKQHLENDFKVELKSAECKCVDGCNSDQNELSPEINDPEAKQNKTRRSRSSGSCIYLSVYALFLIVGAFSI